MLIIDKLAETLAPGEDDELLKIAKLIQQSVQDDYNQETQNSEIIENIKKIYNQYQIQKKTFYRTSSTFNSIAKILGIRSNPAQF